MDRPIGLRDQILFYVAKCRGHETTIDELKSTVDSLKITRSCHEAIIEELNSTVEDLQLRVQQLRMEIQNIRERANRRRQRAIRRRQREATGNRLSPDQIRRYRLLLRLREAAASQGLYFEFEIEYVVILRAAVRADDHVYI